MSMHQWPTLADRPFSRRRFALGGAALAGGLLLPRGAAAAVQTTPATEVKFTVTKDALQAPTGVTSGINHVVVENQTGQDQVHLLTLLLPKGVTKDDIAKMNSQENAPVPDWWLTATMVGNPDWPAAGGRSEGYITYAQGTYAIMNIFGSQWTTFTVTKAATDPAAPAADVEVATKDMSFRGLDDGLPAGRKLLKVTNGDLVAHEMAFLHVPSATTPVDTIEEVLMKVQDPSQFPAGYKSVPGGTGILTRGESMWLYVDFSPGAHAAVCFAPDGWNGPPHAMMGMIKVFTVR